MPDSQSARGQILIMVAVALVMLLSVVGLVIDGSYMFEKRHRLAVAADAAAMTAAIEYHRSHATLPQLYCFAAHAVLINGFTPDQCGNAGTAHLILRHCDDVAATCIA